MVHSKIPLQGNISLLDLAANYQMTGARFNADVFGIPSHIMQ
jgi:hypothetical protein